MSVLVMASLRLRIRHLRCTPGKPGFCSSKCLTTQWPGDIAIITDLPPTLDEHRPLELESSILPPNNSSIKGSSNWIPFKEMFYNNNFMVATGLRSAEDRGIIFSS